MRASNWGKFDPTQLADNFASWKQNLAVPLQKVVRDVESMLNNGLLQRDNAYAALISLDCKHGVPKEFANPFGANKRPIGFHMLACENAVGQPLEFSGTPVAVAGPPALTRNSADGLLYLTVNYAPPLGAASYIRSAAVNSPNNNNLIDLDTTELATFGFSYIAGVGIICPQAGLIRASYSLHLAVNAGGTFRGAFMLKNSSIATLYGNCQSGPGNQPTGFAGTSLIQVSAGNNISLWTSQDSGGNIALQVGSNRMRLDCSYVAPDPTTTARVTGILVGG